MHLLEANSFLEAFPHFDIEFLMYVYMNIYPRLRFVSPVGKKARPALPPVLALRCFFSFLFFKYFRLIVFKSFLKGYYFFLGRLKFTGHRWGDAAVRHRITPPKEWFY